MTPTQFLSPLKHFAKKEWKIESFTFHLVGDFKHILKIQSYINQGFSAL